MYELKRENRGCKKVQETSLDTGMLNRAMNVNVDVKSRDTPTSHCNPVTIISIFVPFQCSCVGYLYTCIIVTFLALGSLSLADY